MADTQPILAGEALISVYTSATAPPSVKDLVVNQLEMTPEFQVVRRHVTGAVAVRHNPILTHYTIKWTANEALTNTEVFGSPLVTNCVIVIVWEPNPAFDGRWKRRIFKDARLQSWALTSEGALQLKSQMSWTAEVVSELAWSESQPFPPAITASDLQ